MTPIVAAVEVSLPPTTDSALPQTPIKRQQRTPSKTVAPIDGEDLVDGNPNQYEEIDGADHESTSHGKRKLVSYNHSEAVAFANKIHVLKPYTF